MVYMKRINLFSVKCVLRRLVDKQILECILLFIPTKSLSNVMSVVKLLICVGILERILPFTQMKRTLNVKFVINCFPAKVV
ncbi:unnamed protein product [Larinioides sclopetarius]|uniref:Uncharacterized protein n=1 Tax=Larinioides sclopetarius TaxID=280406 RepID=A0AAV1ZIR8_9ARAC